MDELSGATSLVQRAGMGNDEESADPSFLETLRAELPRGSDGAVSKEEEERLMEWLKQTGLLEDDTSTTGEKEKGDDVGEIKEEYPFTHGKPICCSLIDGRRRASSSCRGQAVQPPRQ